MPPPMVIAKIFTVKMVLLVLPSFSGFLISKRPKFKLTFAEVEYSVFQANTVRNGLPAQNS